MADFVPDGGVARDLFFSSDAGEIEEFLRSRYSDSVAVRPVDGVGVECGYETTAADGFTLGHTWTTVPTTWDVGPMQDVFVIQHLRTGDMTHTGPAYGEVGAGRDGLVVVPPVGEFHDTAQAFDIDLVALDSERVACFAEYVHGPAAADLRIHALRPVSGEGRRLWLDVVRSVRDDVLGNPLLADSAIVLDRAFRDLAATFLSVFPNSVLASVDDRSAGGRRRYLPESSLREVREYLRAHAGEPVGPMQIAAVAGVPAGDVLDALVRRDARHPAHLLWEARLHGARRDLLDADPATTDVAAVAARWGFARLPAFRLVYETAFGETPETTLG